MWVYSIVLVHVWEIEMIIAIKNVVVREGIILLSFVKCIHLLINFRGTTRTVTKTPQISQLGIILIRHKGSRYQINISHLVNENGCVISFSHVPLCWPDELLSLFHEKLFFFIVLNNFKRSSRCLKSIFSLHVTLIKNYSLCLE